MPYKFLLIFFMLLHPIFADIELESITVTQESLHSSIIDTDEDKQIDNPTLNEKLFNNVLVNQTEDATNGKIISVRGNNARSTDFFEDGIPLYRTGNGFIDLTMYKAYNTILEINPGGLEGIYGTSAVGGEIYLKSKKIKEGFHAIVNTTVSTNDSYINTLVSHKKDDFYVKLDLNVMRQNSFTLSDDFSTTDIQPNTQRVNSDWNQVDGALKLGYIFNEYSDMAVKISHLQSAFGNPINVDDNGSSDYTRVDDKRLTGYWFYYNYKRAHSVFKLRAYFDDYEDTWNWYDSPSFTTLKYPQSQYQDSRLGTVMAWEESYTQKHKGSFSINIDRNRHNRIVDKDPVIYKYETIETAIGYKHAYALSQSLSTTAAVKYKYQNLSDVHQFSTTKVNYEDNQAVDGQLIFNYKQKNKNAHFISVAHKSRFASLRELYPFFDFDAGNENIKPEKSDSIELGTALYSVPNTIINMSLFHNRVGDMIVQETYGFINIEKASIHGAEIRLTNFSFDNHDIESSYAFTHAVDKDNVSIVQIPRSKFYLEDSIELSSKLRFISSFLYVAKRFDTYNSVRYILDSYSLLDVQAVYKKSERLTFKIGAKNILDKKWEYAYSQPAAGRSLFFTLKYDL